MTSTELNEIVDAVVRRLSDGKRAVSIREYADAHGLSECTVRRYVLTGRLPATRIGRKYMIPVSQMVGV